MLRAPEIKESRQSCFMLLVKLIILSVEAEAFLSILAIYLLECLNLGIYLSISFCIYMSTFRKFMEWSWWAKVWIANISTDIPQVDQVFQQTTVTIWGISRENISLLWSHLSNLTFFFFFLNLSSKSSGYLRTNWDYAYKISNNFDQIQEECFLQWTIFSLIVSKYIYSQFDILLYH